MPDRRFWKIIIIEKLLLLLETLFYLKVKNAVIWSDEAAAHFKNCHSIASMSSSDIFSEWNFYESYHGKRPHDGDDAVLKCHVWRKKLWQIILNNAYAFYNEVNSAHSNIKCWYVSDDEIQTQILKNEKNV